MMNSNGKNRRPEKKRNDPPGARTDSPLPGRSRAGFLSGLVINAALFFFLLGAAGCGVPERPLEIKPGEKTCVHCLMNIVDMRFRAQVITKKGKIIHFDSIECLTLWSKRRAGEINSRWVGNFSQKGKWLPYNSARFFHSPKVRSPMGSGLSAHETEGEIQRMMNIFQGKIINRSELPVYAVELRKTRQKNPL